MATISKQIRELSMRWINPTYARMVSTPIQLQALIVHAFVNQVPDGPDVELLREAYKRLQQSSLDTEYP